MLSSGRAQEPPGNVRGTILAIRGDILVVRPSLRPKVTRVAFGPKTQIIGNERAALSVLKPGMRLMLMGRYTQQDGLHPFWIEAAETPIGELKQRSVGLDANQRGWVMVRGNLKSIQPFVFSDDTGKVYTAKLDQLRGVSHDFPGDRNGLLIGTRIQVSGHVASDGVILADVINPDRDIAATGTMFGTITAINGDTLTVRPKYTTETTRIRYAPGCLLQRQVDIDPDTYKVGDRVTFWGQQHNHPWDNPRSDDLLAFALLAGNGRYPSSGGVFLSGKLASVDPVRLTLDSGKTINVIIPAQMPSARLQTIRSADVRPGKQAMLVLKRRAGGGFQATTIVLDASPFVGYGG
jgi:hypothetical protein